jgi:branched-subunit amino acid ABC-type transport system permease component
MLPIDDVFRLTLIGISQGCAYGLVALGFVLIYKATEVVNFAHGDFMMFGGFGHLCSAPVLQWVLQDFWSMP